MADYNFLRGLICAFVNPTVGSTYRASGVRSIQRTGAGRWTVTLKDGFAAGELALTVTPANDPAGSSASWTRLTDTTIAVHVDAAAGTAADLPWSMIGVATPPGNSTVTA